MTTGPRFQGREPRNSVLQPFEGPTPIVFAGEGNPPVCSWNEGALKVVVPAGWRRFVGCYFERPTAVELIEPFEAIRIETASPLTELYVKLEYGRPGPNGDDWVLVGGPVPAGQQEYSIDHLPKQFMLNTIRLSVVISGDGNEPSTINIK